MRCGLVILFLFIAMPSYAAAPAYSDVVAGDTLWDLCEKHMGAGWHWPQIWSYNPEITNPHWIYPGDRIRFTPSSLPLPILNIARVETTVENPPELVSPGEPPVETKSLVVKEPEALGYRVRLLTQLVDSAHSAQGRIMNATPERVLLRSGDQVFIKPSKTLLEVNKVYATYREVGKVRHPKHRKRYTIIEITGAVRIEVVDKHVVQGRLIETWLEVERGHQLADVRWAEISVAEKPVDVPVDVKGQVFVLSASSAGSVAQGYLVYVDFGSDAGLQAGQMLNIVRIPNHRMGPHKYLAEENVGRVLIVDVMKDTSAAVIVDAIDAIRLGDRVTSGS